MSRRGALAVLALLLVFLAGAWLLVERQLSGTWLAFGVHPDVTALLERSLADQKALAALDPERGEEYRRRFEEADTLRRRLRIVEHNRRALIRRFETVLFAVFGVVLVGAGAAYSVREARDRRRLARLRAALEDLCAGRADLRVGDRGRDAVGRVARMIEETSRLMVRDRRRLIALENLSAWQEAARRHAHEMRTPLTAARLEVERLGQLARELESGRDGVEAEIGALAAGLVEELDRLAVFTRRFTSFARLPRPRPEPASLTALAADFVAAFGSAWPNLSIGLEPPEPGEGEEAGGDPWTVRVDRDLLRQVLVNLCDNSAHAVGERGGRVMLRPVAGPISADGGFAGLEVADDGPGLAPEVERRLFEPYLTNRRVGEGMGLGLAIARKILLDHGGDLELVSSSPAGAVFRLTLPRSGAV